MSPRRRLVAGVVAIAVVMIVSCGDSPPPADGSPDPFLTTTTGVADEVDDDADPLPTATAAAVTQVGDVGEPGGPTDVPPPPSPPFEPAPITPFEESGEDAFIEPVPVEIPDQPGGIGDITSNAVGCASDCITSVLLTPQLLSADLGFEIRTNVSATTTVWVSTLPIQEVGGTPTIPGAFPIAWTPFPRSIWSTTLEDLEFSTTYNVLVAVEDFYGNKRYATTEYTTVDRPTPGQLVGNGGGCYYQCIVSGTVYPTDSYDTVLLSVTTSLPVEFDISVSQSEPGSIGGSPFLPKDEPFIVEQDSGNAIGGSITDLEADTTYHVVVKVTDEHGFTSHAVGEFHTSAPPPKPTWVLITLERVTIDQDGDSVGDGEIKFVWGLENGLYRGERDYDKIGDGDTIVLPEGSGVWYPVWDPDDIPNMIFNAIEQDRQRSLCAGGVGTSGVLTENVSDFECGKNTTVAHIGPHPLSWIDSLPACSSYFQVVFGQDRPCVVINSGDLDDDWVVFRAIFSFETWVAPDE